MTDCKHEIISVDAKCDDRCSINNEEPDYVPKDLGIGGGDYIRFKFCKKCRKIID